MKKYLQLFLLTFLIVMFTSCSAKEIKEVGSNASSSGAMGLLVGGALYGIGSLMDEEETNKERDNEIGENKNEM